MNVKNAKYGLACVTSVGVRITPADRMAVQNSDMFYMQATSAETNVLNVSSALGISCLALTKLVDGSPIADFIGRKMRSRGIELAAKKVAQGGPWGYRHQFNIADSGFGLRAPRVWNDRAGEVGRTIDAADFDLEQIFVRDGVGILHLSGLICAMSEQTTKACVEIAEYAKKAGTLISFDLNYRATFWKGREEELSAAFKRIAAISDILVGNEEDFQLCLGIEGPEAGGRNLSDKAESFKEMILRVRKVYPGAQVLATTLRQVISANSHLWGAVMYAEGEFFVEQPREIDVLDRIGGGDGFTGGLLYSVYTGKPVSDWVRYGWAAGVLAASSLNDYAEPADEKQLLDIYAGNARVQR